MTMYVFFYFYVDLMRLSSLGFKLSFLLLVVICCWIFTSKTQRKFLFSFETHKVDFDFSHATKVFLIDAERKQENCRKSKIG